VKTITLHYHGLRAAEQLLALLDELARNGHIEISHAQLDLEGGNSAQLKHHEYMALARTAVAASIAELKLRRDNLRKLGAPATEEAVQIPVD
jgi:hypothetical protein